MLKDIKVPMLAESVSEATLVSWHKQAGERIKRGENLIDIETDKVTLEITAPEDGTLEEILREGGSDVQSDEVIARISTGTATDHSTPQQSFVNNSEAEQQPLPILQPSQAVAAEDSKPSNQADIKLSPAVRNMMDNHNLNGSDIAHDHDRITKADIIKHQENQENNTETVSRDTLQTDAANHHSAIADNTSINTTAAEFERGENRVPMNRLRQRIADRLLSAQQENAILTTFNEVNMQPVKDLRSRYQDEFEKAHGVRLGFMSFFCKAAIEALKRYPIMNASVDGKDIVYHEYFDIGIAVSSPKGLFVPVVREADVLSLAEIEKMIRDYGEKAQAGTLGIEELTGGTFTITNGGVFGSLLSTPILNPPQSAILGMHKMQERPIAENNEVVIRPMMYLALSYDHRIIDGREAVQFLVAIKEQLEDPARLLLQI